MDMDDAEYYRNVWGFDPVVDRTWRSKNEFWYEECYDLVNDASLREAGVKICARVVAKKNRRVRNYIVFRRGGVEATVNCVHTAVTTVPVDAPVDDPALLEAARSTETHAVDLSPEEHFASLKSYVAGIASFGLGNLLAASYLQPGIPDPVRLPFGFNEAMQLQVMRAVRAVAPRATERLVCDYLVGLAKEAGPAWVVSRLNYLDDLYGVKEVIFRNVDAFRRVDGELQSRDFRLVAARNEGTHHEILDYLAGLGDEEVDEALWENAAVGYSKASAAGQRFLSKIYSDLVREGGPRGLATFRSREGSLEVHVGSYSLDNDPDLRDVRLELRVVHDSKTGKIQACVVFRGGGKSLVVEVPTTNSLGTTWAGATEPELTFAYLNYQVKRLVASGFVNSLGSSSNLRRTSPTFWLRGFGWRTHAAFVEVLWELVPEAAPRLVRDLFTRLVSELGPSTWEKVRVWDSQYRVTRAFFSDPVAFDAVDAKLGCAPFWALAASSPATHPRILEKLALQVDVEVCEALLGNPSLPKRAFKRVRDNLRRLYAAFPVDLEDYDVPSFLPSVRVRAKSLVWPTTVVVVLSGALAYLVAFSAGMVLDATPFPEQQYGAVGGSLLNATYFLGISVASSFVILYLVKRMGEKALKYVVVVAFFLLGTLLLLFYGEVVLYVLRAPEASYLVNPFVAVGASLALVAIQLGSSTNLRRNAVAVAWSALIGSFFGSVMSTWTTVVVLLALGGWEFFSVSRGPMRQILGEMGIWLEGEEEDARVSRVVRRERLRETPLDVGIGQLIWFSTLTSHVLVSTGSLVAFGVTTAFLLVGNRTMLGVFQKARVVPGVLFPLLFGLAGFAVGVPVAGWVGV
ncbi:MAG: hypothetical protein Kow0069_21870 [Promethearchaeota archaeon]